MWYENARIPTATYKKASAAITLITIKILLIIFPFLHFDMISFVVYVTSQVTYKVIDMVYDCQP